MVMGTSHYNREGASARIVWSLGKVDAPDSESFAIALFTRIPLAGAVAGCVVRRKDYLDYSPCALTALVPSIPYRLKTDITLTTKID